MADIVDKYVQELSAGDSAERAEAASHLGYLEDSRALESLVSALGDMKPPSEKQLR